MAEKSPNYRVAEVERVRDKIYLMLVEEFLDVRLSVSEHKQLVANMLRMWPKVKEDVWFESLRFLAGHTLSADQLHKLAWRVAANMPTLKKGRNLPAQVYDYRGDQACVALIRSGRDTVNTHGKQGVLLEFLILTGWAASMELSQFAPLSILAPIAQRLGFTAPWEKRPYLNWHDLIGLRVAGSTQFNRFEDGLVLGEFLDHHTTAQWNIDNVLNMRFRLKGKLCPRQFNHPCRKCVIGYDQCPAGTHPVTYEYRECVVCKQDSVIDPHLSQTTCIPCFTNPKINHANNDPVQEAKPAG